MKKWIVYAILVIILFVGAWLRNYNLSVWPREGATFDEFAWVFQGLSLWENGIPTSWSPHQAYKNKVEYYNPQGAHFVLVTPYLEHPPLFGLVAGGFARLNAIKSYDEVTIPKIRVLALLMGLLAIYAVFLLASAVYGESIGLLSAAIYAVIPTVVIGSRLVQNENFFIPVFLFALYFAYKYIQESTRNQESGTRNLFITLLLCAPLPLAKVPWIAAPIAVATMFLFCKKWKPALIVAVTTLLFFSLYVIYGFMLDKELFFNLWKLQLARYDMAFDSMFLLFRDPLIADRTFVDGWIYFGWFAIFLILLKDLKRNLPIIAGFIAYFFIFVFAIPGEPLHGWYRYPFYPFLAIATAVFLKEYFNKNYPATGAFFLLIGLSMLAGSWGRILGFSYVFYRLYLLLVFSNVLPIVFPAKNVRGIIHLINYFLCVILICLSAWATIAYNEQ